MRKMRNNLKLKKPKVFKLEIQFADISAVAYVLNDLSALLAYSTKKQGTLTDNELIGWWAIE